MTSTSKSSRELTDDVHKLSEDDLRALLDEVVDHNKPDSQKCALAQRLKSEQVRAADASDATSATLAITAANATKYLANKPALHSGSSVSPSPAADQPAHGRRALASGDDEPQVVEMCELSRRATYQRYSANGARESTSPSELPGASGAVLSHRGASATDVDSSLAFPFDSRPLDHHGRELEEDGNPIDQIQNLLSDRKYFGNVRLCASHVPPCAKRTKRVAFQCRSVSLSSWVIGFR